MRVWDRPSARTPAGDIHVFDIWTVTFTDSAGATTDAVTITLASTGYRANVVIPAGPALGSRRNYLNGSRRETASLPSIAFSIYGHASKPFTVTA